MDRESIGVEILQSIWYNTALKILELSKKVYDLNEDQYKALKEIFAKPNDYVVIVRDD
jgi:hypothetical protein